jgi:multidrug resistance efflux pump
LKKLLLVIGAVLILSVSLWFFYFLYLHYRFVVTDNAFQWASFTQVSTEDVSGKIVKLYGKEYQRVEKGEPLFKVDDSELLKELSSVKAQLSALEAQERAARVRLERLKRQLPVSVREAELSADALKAQLKALDAQVESAEVDYRAAVESARSSVAAARSALEAAKVALEKSKNRYERYRRLYGRKVISKEQFEEVEVAYAKSKAAYSEAESGLVKARAALERAEALKFQVESLKRKRAALLKQLAAAEQRVVSAEANLKRLKEVEALLSQIKAQREALLAKEEKVKLLISHTLVRSPVSGFIAKKWKELGDFVSPGLPVYSVYSPKSFYVLAWVDEDKVSFLRVGTTGRVELAACGGRSFRAKVVAVGRSAGSVFALIPKDTSEGEYTRVVQRVPVKVEVQGVPLYCVKPGTNATVYLKKER